MKIRAPFVLAQFADFVEREYEKWKVVVRESGATAE